MAATVVVYPSAGVGHLVPMVELGKLLTRHGYKVTILIMHSPWDSPSAAATFERIASANPSISFHHLPPVPLPPNPPTNFAMLLFDILRSMNAHVLRFLESLSQSSPVRALVLDFFCTDALDVAAELGIPAYFFFSTSASNLAAFVHLPTLQQSAASLQDLGDNPIDFPGRRPVPASHIPSTILDNEEVFRDFLYHFERLPRADGIIVNTFQSLETRAIKAIADGLCLPGRPMPPTYCVGPLVSDGREQEREKHECLAWLDSQPAGRVVFLSFGSKGAFSAEQLREIAVGLECSGQRFLWVVRSPPSEDAEKRFKQRPDPDLGSLLPEGFLERTKERGLVVKSWAPQVAVLGHEAVGGFVTHCGWNSVLEAVRAGVPMIAWPLYAEQWMNKLFLVEEAKLAVEMKGYDKGWVGAEEVETRVRGVMESDGGRELRKRAAAAKESAASALREGGSSHAALFELVKSLMKACKQPK